MEPFYLTLLLLFVSFITLSFFVLLYKHKSNYTAPNLPPGNSGLPIVGETIEFLSNGWKGQPEKFVFDRIAKYSCQVFKTHLIGQPAAVFSGANGNKFLFSNENKLVTLWWPKTVDKIFPTSSQTSSQEESRKLRNRLHEVLKSEALQRYINIMDTIAQRHCAAEWENRDEVLVLPLVKRYTLWLACRLFFSIEDPNQVAKFESPFAVLTSGLVSVPIDVPGTPFNRAIKASKLIRQNLLKIVKQRKVDLAGGNASPTQDILSNMLVTTDEDGQFMKELDIADKILGLMVGGQDNVTATTTCVIKYLAELPHIYEQVYNEQIEIAKSKAPGEMLNWNDIQKMKYSWHVACEVLRLLPPIPGTYREAINDFTFNGFSIPKGWKLYWSASSTHKNPEYFPKPEKFDPKRFEGSGPAPYTFVPFGGGPRMCPGKEYTRLALLVFIHNLVKRFKWEKVVPDEKIVVDPVPIPAKGLPLRLYPH